MDVAFKGRKLFLCHHLESGFINAFLACIIIIPYLFIPDVCIPTWIDGCKSETKNVCVAWSEFNGAGVTLIVDLKWSCESSFNGIFLLMADYEGQGSPHLMLEGRCPAQFSSNLPQHTYLQVSSKPRKTLISWFRCV